MSDYLLDTHVWLWLQAAPERIDAGTLNRLARADTLLLSAASAWEISIKYALGRLPLPEPPSSYLPSRISASGTTMLPIELSHTTRAGALPPHHRDPFDRMLVAQAQIMRVPIVTADDLVTAYEVRCLRV